MHNEDIHACGQIVTSLNYHYIILASVTVMYMLANKTHF